MNAYLAEVVKKREEIAKKSLARDIALNLLDEGLGTLEQIAKSTGLALAEVTRLSRMRKEMSE